ncbi:uncharacterized protein B0P05DRAFT_550597 [Gilbertella persicaria]|uniref:uncharacterized protein n=1 Tax=Gilbertella persicaria TaxID=101096 RepID=UPI00221FE37B|nr:uncharacterized protein B0P05DRAFT_550597 [Gilbertella persicaria]KAI8070659.1 hypothetical protein B0P05DRAFT_550597 [Gilbertella persicaria]
MQPFSNYKPMINNYNQYYFTTEANPSPLPLPPPLSSVAVDTSSAEFHYQHSPPLMDNRKLWSERVLRDMAGLLHVLSPTGKFLYCSDSCVELTGYQPHELTGKSLTDFLHIDDVDMFIKNFQLAFHSLSRIRVHFRLRRKDNTYLLLESIGQPKQNPSSFFAIAQPYFSRSNGLLDSFHEIKMENEWLKKRLNSVLQVQENCSLQPSFQENQLLMPFQDQQQQTNSRRLSSCSTSTLFQNNTTGDEGTHIYWSHHRYTTPPSVASSSELNEMFIRLQNQQQNHEEDPISTSPHFPHSTMDSKSKDKWKRRKKNKLSDNHVCSDCGTNSSPEWRKGPHGPKT